MNKIEKKISSATVKVLDKVLKSKANSTSSGLYYDSKKPHQLERYKTKK